MSKRLLIGALGVILVTGMASYSTASESLRSDWTNAPNQGTPQTAGIEVLFQGDLGAELGLGCSSNDGSGTTGGPNDWAQGVTAATPTPFNITSTFYNMFENGSGATGLSFVAWAGGGASPGIEFGRQPVPAAVGSHTVAIAPAIAVSAGNAPGGALYFGFNQFQTNAGMRMGMDSSTASAGTFLRAPTCGAVTFTAPEILGPFPGNWVYSCTVDDGATTPVELTTWGAVKAQYND